MYRLVNFKEGTSPYHKGAVLAGGGFKPSYADTMSPHGNVGGRYVEVDSRLAQRVGE